ncbi:MAG: efflux RND transporter periplasmic adaptor subunit [Nitrospira sp. LK265]|nr:efflux RND transporter periplasmic adaptor subunit [Nitrospira sp.]NGZ61419.1 efflux RND transporter periplasmic adaptor subunit [Nitrospira sp. LK265]
MSSRQVHDHEGQGGGESSDGDHVRGRSLVNEKVVRYRGVLTAAFIAILSCALYFGYHIYGSKNDAAALHPDTPEETLHIVSVVPTVPTPQSETITFPGNIVGWYEAPIYARVTGYVKMWHKKYGDAVKTGEVLAEISTPDLDAEYQQAKADLRSQRAWYKLADVTAKRLIGLRPTYSVSEQSVTVQAQHMKTQAAMVKAAEQRVKNIEAFIGFKKIIAPFDGVVIQRNINVGDLVSKEGNLSDPNGITNLYTVAVIDKLRLFVNVPERFAPFLHPGLTVDVTVPQLPDRHFTFNFLTIARHFQVGTRTVTSVFTIDNKDHALWPGSYAQVQITAPVNRQAFTIPLTALVFQENSAQVAILTEDDRVHYKRIEIGRLNAHTIDVAEGLSASDRIINNPSNALLEGEKVRIVTKASGEDLPNTQEPVSEQSSAG